MRSYISEGLKGFNTIVYKVDDKPAIEFHDREKKIEQIANLLVNMVIFNASDDEFARVIRHSMVLLDAIKLHLDWEQSEKDNGLDYLIKKYLEV